MACARRDDVKPDHVAELVDEPRVVGELELPHPMRRRSMTPNRRRRAARTDCRPSRSPPSSGCDGLLRDKTRPSRIPPLGAEVADRVVALTLTDPPAEATHWTAAMMARLDLLRKSGEFPMI